MENEEKEEEGKRGKRKRKRITIELYQEPDTGKTTGYEHSTVGTSVGPYELTVPGANYPYRGRGEGGSRYLKRVQRPGLG